MSRYIDADEFYTKLSEWSLIHGAVTRGEMGLILETMHHIDIVRCSECKHLRVHNTEALYAFCSKWGIEFYPFEEDTRTHGCSWGEQNE